MAKFFLGLLTGIVVVLAIGLLFLALLRFQSRPPAIADNSVLVLRLSGDIPEKPPLELPGLPRERQPWRDDRERLAGASERRRRFAHQGRGPGAGAARRRLGASSRKCARARAVPQVRQAGLRLPAAARARANTTWRLAADRIYMPPEDLLMLKGLRAEMMYFRNTLDKIGVQVEVEHAGKYKDFGDMFTRTDMSPETREVMNSVLDDLYGNLVARIARGAEEVARRGAGHHRPGAVSRRSRRSSGLVDALRLRRPDVGRIDRQAGRRRAQKGLALGYLQVPAEPPGDAGRTESPWWSPGDHRARHPGDDGPGDEPI